MKFHRLNDRTIHSSQESHYEELYPIEKGKARTQSRMKGKKPPQEERKAVTEPVDVFERHMRGVY